MRRPTVKTSVIGVLAAALALTAAAPSAQGAGEASAPPAPRAGALPVALSPAQQARLLADAAEDRAATAEAIGLSAEEKLVPGSVLKDADGTVHTRYERTYRGLPVLGGDLVVHTPPDGAAERVTRATRATISLPTTTPARSAAAAESAALAGAGEAGTSRAKAADPPRAVVWAATGRPVLAWESVIKGVQPDRTPSSLHVISDAATGEELHRYDAVKRGTGQTHYSGQVSLGSTPVGGRYTLTDTARGSHKTYIARDQYAHGSIATDDDDVWGNGIVGDAQTTAADVAYGARVAWDYFADVHHRYGVRNDGDGAKARVIAPTTYTDRQANWSDDCFCATFGAGSATEKPLTSLDMTVHELTHGLTSNTAKLIYIGEAGGLSEATSDIFAAAAEFRAGNTADPGDYLFAEKVNLLGDGKPLRAMDRPAKVGAQANYWYQGIAEFDGHYSSGPANHWFYLLSEGSGPKTVNGVSYDSPTVDGLPVTPIGRDAAAQIWYRALTLYMTSATGYAGARTATLSAAADLYGAGSATYINVREAWGAVNVGTRSGSPNPPTTPGPAFENTTDVPIPDGKPDGSHGAVVSSPITVTGVAGNAPALLQVEFDIQHFDIPELTLELVAPDGTAYPLRGNRSPVRPLKQMVDASAEAANGTWKLRAQDRYEGDFGHINSWKLSF